MGIDLWEHIVSIGGLIHIRENDILSDFLRQKIHCHKHGFPTSNPKISKFIESIFFDMCFSYAFCVAKSGIAMAIAR